MARHDEKLDHLSRSWLFQTVTKKDLATVARASTEVQVPAGRVLCEEGAVGQEFFLILDGTAAVRRRGRKIAMLSRGDHFGELALLSRLPRNATVTAETDMDLLVLNQREFATVLEEVPRLSAKLLEAMALRLREADTRATAS